MPRFPWTRTWLAAGAAALLAQSAPAATLTAGDFVVLAREYTYTPGVLIHVDPAIGVVDTIVPQPPPPDPYDLVVRPDGAILVADRVAGLVLVAPGTGATQVLAAPAAFGGTGPTTLAYADNGDLLLAGPGGMARWSDGLPQPTPLVGAPAVVQPRGVADDGRGGIWLTDEGASYPLGGGLLHLDGTTGASIGLPTLFFSTSPAYAFPLTPLQVRRGPDGCAYVVSAPYSGPTQYLNSGIFRVDPVTGEMSRWKSTHFVRGFLFDHEGRAWVLFGMDISRDPYNGELTSDGGLGFGVGARGPVAQVPFGTVSVRRQSWGAIKSRYR
jgi:streptogramin lyase